MLSKSVSVMLLVALISCILIFHGANYENPSVAFAADSDSQPVAQVPINVTNTQSVAIPSPFQVMIQVNSTEYSVYEAADLSNIAFAYSNGTVIPSWLESGNSNSSTDTVYWLKVGRIPVKSTMTVFMDFYPVTDNVLNNMTTGEAPQLSPTYGEYDDGSNVFITYGNFNNSLSEWQVYQYSGNFLPVPSATGVEMLNGNGNEETYLLSPVVLPQIPVEVEEGWSYSGNGVNFPKQSLSMFGNSPFGTTTGVIFQNGAVVLNNSVYATYDFDHVSPASILAQSITNNVVSSGSFMASGSYNVVSLLTVNSTWAFAGYSIGSVSIANFGSALIPTVLSGQVPNPFANHALITSAYADGSSSEFLYVTWVVARAFPPNGVAPTVTIGKVEAVPEFPSFVILPIFMIATLIAVMISKKKRKVIHITSLQEIHYGFSYRRLFIESVQACSSKPFFYENTFSH